MIAAGIGPAAALALRRLKHRDPIIPWSSDPIIHARSFLIASHEFSLMGLRRAQYLRVQKSYIVFQPD
jgi:hypothetical protein